MTDADRRNFLPTAALDLPVALTLSFLLQGILSEWLIYEVELEEVEEWL